MDVASKKLSVFLRLNSLTVFLKCSRILKAVIIKKIFLALPNDMGKMRTLPFALKTLMRVYKLDA